MTACIDKGRAYAVKAGFPFAHFRQSARRRPRKENKLEMTICKSKKRSDRFADVDDCLSDLLRQRGKRPIAKTCRRTNCSYKTTRIGAATLAEGTSRAKELTIRHCERRSIYSFFAAFIILRITCAMNSEKPRHTAY